MKRAIIGLLVLALVDLAGATSFVRNSATTHVEGWITVPIICLDTLPSAGPLNPDSLHVIVWRDSSGVNVAAYDTSLTDTASAYWDYDTQSGMKYWYFRSLVSDIDGDGSVGPYHGLISAWGWKHPTPNRFSFQIIDSDTTFSAIVHHVSGAMVLLDSILESVGYDTCGPLEKKSLQQKIGKEWMISDPTVRELFSGLGVMVDSLDRRLGWPGVSRAGDPVATLFHILGGYSGQPGDNNNIKEDVAALSLTGSGSEACTLIVKQDGLNPIQGARIVIRTIDQLATRVPGLFTDTDGRGISELDYGDYFVSVMANNYVSFSDTLNVNCDSTWVLSMTLFDPGQPPSPPLCRVYGWVYDITGNALVDVVVTAEIPSSYQPVKYGEIVVTPFSKSTITDSTGYWQLDLLPNSVLSEPLSKYLITIEYPSGVVYKSRVTVPQSASWQLN